MMSTTRIRSIGTAPAATIAPDLATACLVTLLGLMLSLAVLSCLSSETISAIFVG
jgi:hypothetical protein